MEYPSHKGGLVGSAAILDGLQRHFAIEYPTTATSGHGSATHYGPPGTMRPTSTIGVGIVLGALLVLGLQAAPVGAAGKPARTPDGDGSICRQLETS